MPRKPRKSPAPRKTVSTVYDHATKTYVAQRVDGSVTVGRFNEKGSNFRLPR